MVRKGADLPPAAVPDAYQLHAHGNCKCINPRQMEEEILCCKVCSKPAWHMDVLSCSKQSQVSRDGVAVADRGYRTAQHINQGLSVHPMMYICQNLSPKPSHQAAVAC